MAESLDEVLARVVPASASSTPAPVNAPALALPQQSSKPNPGQAGESLDDVLARLNVAPGMKSASPAAPDESSRPIKSLERGYQGLRATGAGLAALASEAVGAPETAEDFYQSYRAHNAKAQALASDVPSYSDIRTDSIGGFATDAGKYAVDAVFENLPMFLPSLVTGGIGAAAARRGAEEIVNRMVATQMASGVARETAEREAANMIAKKVATGAALGAYPASAGMEAGDIYGNIVDQTGERAPGTALLAGAAAGALDVIPQVAALRKAMGPVVDDAVGGLVRRLGVNGAKLFAEEAGTEGLQNLIEQGAVQTVDPNQAIDWNQVIDNTLKGGIGGLVLGGGSEAIASARGHRTAAEATPAVPEVPGANAPAPSAETPAPPVVVTRPGVSDTFTATPQESVPTNFLDAARRQAEIQGVPAPAAEADAEPTVEPSAPTSAAGAARLGGQFFNRTAPVRQGHIEVNYEGPTVNVPATYEERTRQQFKRPEPPPAQPQPRTPEEIAAANRASAGQFFNREAIINAARQLREQAQQKQRQQTTPAQVPSQPPVVTSPQPTQQPVAPATTTPAVTPAPSLADQLKAMPRSQFAQVLRRLKVTLSAHPRARTRTVNRLLKDHGEAAIQAAMQPRAAAAPKSTARDLLAFLRAQGGIKDTGGELRGMDAGRVRPGLINNRGGLDADEAGLRAHEAGYFPERPTVAQLLDAIGTNLRGQPHFSERDRMVVNGANEATQAARFSDQEMQTREAIVDYGKAINEPFHAADIDAVLRIMAEKDLGAEAAVSDYVEGLALAQAEDNARRTKSDDYKDVGDIPFGESAQTPERATPRGERPATTAGGPVREQAARTPVAENAPRVENTEQGQQYVLNGAERESDKTVAQRKADETPKPKQEQKGIDGLGLFDEGARDTPDLFNPNKPKLYSVTPASREENLKRGSEAVARVLADKADVHGAMRRADVGPISFIWGDKSAGIAHILQQRAAEGRDGHALVRILPQLIERGRLGPYYLDKFGKHVRRNIVHQGKTVVLQPYRDGDRLTWVVSAFYGRQDFQPEGKRISAAEAEKRISGALGKRYKLLADATQVGQQDVHQGEDPLAAAHPREERSAQLGAETVNNIGREDAARKAATAIVDRVTGGKAEVSFEPVIYGEGEEIKASGAATADRQAVAGYFDPARSLIAIALDPRFNANDTAAHEAWHWIRASGLLSDQERAVLDRQAQRLRDIAAKAVPNADSLTNEEAEAIAFARFYQQGEQRGLLPAIRRAFQRVTEVLRGLASWARGEGYTSVDDIFGRAKRGEIAARVDSQTPTTEAFRKWFGDSHVVDSNGDPLVVYHGTTANIEAFDGAKQGTNTKAPSAYRGFFFTDRRETAEYYSGGMYGNVATARNLIAKQNRADEAFARALRAGGQNEQADQIEAQIGDRAGPNVVAVYLSIQNPLVHDFGGRVFRDETYRSLIDQAKAEGRDGVILRNTFDAGEYNKLDAVLRGRLKPETIYVAFAPEQIKSATDNNGAFSPNDARIKYSIGPVVDAAPAQDRGTAKEIEKSYGRVATATMGVINRIEKLSNPVVSLPETNAYLQERYRTLGRIAQVQEVAKRLYQTFKDLKPAEQKAVYDFLTNADASANSIVNETTRTAAVATKNYIVHTGEMLVERGLLDPETFAETRGTYLPRVYLKHLLPKDVNIGRGNKASDLGYLKKRQDIPADVRRLILGEITDPGYLASRAIGQPMRDMAILDFLEHIAGNRTWVFPQSLVQWDGKNVSVQWLSAEADRIRKQIPYMTDETAQRDAIAVAKRMQDIVDPALEEIGKAPKDYRQVPDSARYGRLRGMWVRKEIFDDLIGGMQLLPGDSSIAEKLLGAGGIGTKITQVWKMGKVALNPPSQARNFVSNGLLLYLSGVSPLKLPGRIVEAIHEIRTNGRYWQVAKEYGVTASTFSANELMRIEREFIDIQAKTGGPIARMKRIGAIIANTASDSYQFSESLFKTAKIIDAMKKGLSPAEAAIEAHKWMFDYSLVSPGVKYLRNAPIGAPFITFAAKALPRMLEVAVRHPLRLMPFVALPYLLSMAIANDYDVDKDDVDKLKQALPNYIREKSNAYLLPYKDANGRWQVIDIGYFFPWSQYQDLAQAMAAGDPSKTLGALGLFGGPLPDIIVAINTNTDPFTGKKIVDPRDPPAKQAADLMTYTWRMAAPTWVTDIGVAGHFYDLLRGRVDPRTGDPLLTPSQAALRLFGTNVYPIEPERSRLNNIRSMNFEIQDTKARMRQQLRDRNLTPEQRANIRDDYMDLIKSRTDTLRQYSEASRINPKLATQREAVAAP